MGSSGIVGGSGAYDFSFVYPKRSTAHYFFSRFVLGRKSSDTIRYNWISHKRAQLNTKKLECLNNFNNKLTRVN